MVLNVVHTRNKQKSLLKKSCHANYAPLGCQYPITLSWLVMCCKFSCSLWFSKRTLVALHNYDYVIILQNSFNILLIFSLISQRHTTSDTPHTMCTCWICASNLIVVCRAFSPVHSSEWRVWWHLNVSICNNGV